VMGEWKSEILKFQICDREFGVNGVSKDGIEAGILKSQISNLRFGI